jgi:lipopolysaccharide/colanic/teichoic acid biosynthesis glycosyltransferase
MPKRLFDLVVAALLLVILAPLMLGLALAIKLDSPGPALFRQERVGRHGARFRIHKFRTMAVDAPLRGPAVTPGRDPRVTRIGRWLRHYRLDELPQLFDVLRGAMSLVGPRPELPRFVDRYPADLRAQVLAVRPGITDPASIAHLDESALLAESADPERDYVEKILPAKLRLQASYAAHATLRSDIAVLGRTLAALLKR